MAGGGSGGHVTPVLAILEALAAKEKDLDILFVCDKKFAPQAKTILARSTLPITLKTVQAGKLRRYHGVPLWKQLLDIPTVTLNIRDSFLIGIGILQSRKLMKRFKPAVVCGKGGFVCLPVGVAAHQLRIPLVIHDSDAHPGLTNRILSKWATAIATGSPLENYNYPKSRAHYTGIPVGAQFRAASDAECGQYKKTLLHDASRQLVAVVGGGLGAKPLNDAIIAIAPTIHKQNAEVILVTGTAHAEAVQQTLRKQPSAVRELYHVEPFVDAEKMAHILKAADVVVSRGGATAIAELAILGKATVLVPGQHLAGGQQLKNAKSLEAAGAVVMVEDAKLRKNSTILEQALLWVLKNNATRQTLQKRITAFAKPHAAADVAKLILQAAGQGRKG